MIYLNSNSAYSNPDIGFAFNYNDGVYRHGGFFRDASDNGTFKVFENYSPEPDANIFIDTAHASFRLANIAATTFFGNVSGTAGTLSNFTTANLAEGTNQYFTNARVTANVIALLPSLAGFGITIQANGQINASAVASSGFASTANIANTVLSISNFTTANLAEGTNLYYTNARVYAAIQGNLALKANVVDLTTANVSELTNLYYTNTRVYSNVIALLPTLSGSGITIQANGQISANTQTVSLAGLSTTNLAEGSNLYYTNTRVRTAFTAGKGIAILGDGTIKSTAAGGDYNISLTGATAYTVSNIMAGVTFTGSTAADRFIIRSIQVTNISESNLAYVSANVKYSAGNTAYLGNLITVPLGGFVEFINRTQILQSGDSLYFQGYDNNFTPTSNILSAYLTYETITNDTSYIGVGQTLANANSNVSLVTADSTDFVIESIKFVNLKPTNIPVKLYFANSATLVPKAYLAYNMQVPAGSSLEILQSPKVLKQFDALYASYANSSNADSIAVFTSYRKAEQTTVGFTSPSVSAANTAIVTFNTSVPEGTVLYYTIE